MRRPRLRWALLLVAACALLVAVPGDAEAQLNPCAPSAPAPRRPDTGMPGWFATTPAKPPASAGPATAPDDLFASYGTAGLWWPSWDLGCSGSAEGLVTDMANVPMDWMSATLNGTASVRQIAWAGDWLRPLDESVAALTDRLGNFFGIAMGLALTAVGVWMLFRARTAEYGEITTAGAWAVLMIALAALALSYPAWAGRTWDDTVVGSAKLVNDTLAGEADARAGADPAVGQINGDVAYRVWLRGMFGSDTTRTAEAFGPRFYAAMAFAWSELPTLDRGGPEAEAMTEAHRQAFVDAARDLEAADPSAYRTMQGKGAFSSRVPTGLLGWVLVGCLCFMAGVAAALVLVARLVGRGLVMALPIVIPFGTLYRWSGPVRKLGGMAQAVVVALITATVAGGLMTRAVGALLGTSWPLWLVGLVSLVATYAAWKALKPIGTVAGLVGLGGAARLPRHAMGAVLAAAGVRAGAKAGVEAGEEPAMASARRASRAEEYSAAPP
ncbi:MAG: hypothetical protein ACRD0A_12565, partial [Acidimicrobiales bacterium]